MKLVYIIGIGILIMGCIVLVIFNLLNSIKRLRNSVKQLENQIIEEENAPKRFGFFSETQKEFYTKLWDIIPDRKWLIWEDVRKTLFYFSDDVLVKFESFLQVSKDWNNLTLGFFISKINFLARFSQTRYYNDFCDFVTEVNWKFLNELISSDGIAKIKDFDEKLKLILDFFKNDWFKRIPFYFVNKTSPIKEIVFANATFILMDSKDQDHIFCSE
jgi:hypothetical protein